MCNKLQGCLYFDLAEKYKAKNVNKSWLCYENARYHYKKEHPQGEDSFAAKCQKEMRKLERQSDFCVAKTAIVILSYNQGELTRACIESIRENNDADAYELIVVDNASTDGIQDWLREQKDVRLIENEENLGFPYGCNQGIAAAGKSSDIFLLNNDTLVPENAIFWLRMGLYEMPCVGAAGSVSNHVVNYQQVEEQFDTADEWMEYARQKNVLMAYPYESKSWLVGFAMMIKRTALEEVLRQEREACSGRAGQEGLAVPNILCEVLDTRFSPGNFEDNDLSIRLLMGGYRLFLVKNSFIFHYGGRTFEKMPEAYRLLLQENRKKMAQKYGIDLIPYSAVESALIDLVKPKGCDFFFVLEIGCGLGASLARIESRYPQAQVLGIEENELLASLAQNVVPVVSGNFEKDFQLDETYDYIILDGIMEAESDGLLNKAVSYLKKDGRILASVCNAQCIKNKENCMGMTLEEITALCNRCRLQIQGFHYRGAELSEEEKREVEKLCGSWDSPLRPLYEAHKFIFEITV